MFSAVPKNAHFDQGETMFERFSENARRAVFFSRYEATQTGSPSIESEHLLLGMLRTDASLIDRLFPAGVSKRFIEGQIEFIKPSRDKIDPASEIPMEDECKRILSYACEEAEHCRDRYVRPEHIAIGILLEGQCLAATILHEHDLTVLIARKKLELPTSQ